MPNATPPGPRPAWTTRDTAPRHGVPASWTGAAELLAGAAPTLGDRAPVNTGLLATATAPTASPDLTALWTLPQAPGRPDARFAVRRLDAKGRLMLPVTLTGTGKVHAAAERSGPVLTVYLSDSIAARPAGARLVAPLPLDERGRLTVSRAARADLGWEPGTDLLISFDPARGAVRICVASILDDEVSAALTRLQQPAVPTAAATTPPVHGSDAGDDVGGTVIALHLSG